MLSVPPPAFREPDPPPEGGPDAPDASRSASGPKPADDDGAFFRTTLGPLRRYLARLIGSREEAQDIAQSAYARVYTVMREREVAHPRALLYTTARHLALDEIKHRDRSPFAVAPVDAAPSGAPGIEATVMAREEADLLARAIDRLPAECRNVLLLRTGEGLTHEQAAARLGLTRKQAEKRLHRAVRLLHLELNAPPAPGAAHPR